MFKKFDIVGMILIACLILFILIAPASSTNSWSGKKATQAVTLVEEDKGTRHDMR